MKQNNIRLEWMDPTTLKPNPNNYRTHGDQQKKILAAVLDEVGWAGVALYNETTGRLIDGHARREHCIQKGEQMPVIVGSWSEADEKKILATLDPIAAMAGQLDEAYSWLLEQVQTNNEDLQTWCSNLIHELASKDDDLGKIPSIGPVDEVQLEQCPKCGFEWKRS